MYNNIKYVFSNYRVCLQKNFNNHYGSICSTAIICALLLRRDNLMIIKQNIILIILVTNITYYFCYSVSGNVEKPIIIADIYYS